MLDILVGHMNLILIIICCIVIFVMLVLNIIAIVLLVVVLIFILFRNFDAIDSKDLRNMGQPLNKAVSSAGNIIGGISKKETIHADEVDIGTTFGGESASKESVKEKPTERKKESRVAVAQWDFSGQDGELSFKTGEFLEILEKGPGEGDGWIKARSQKTGVVGLAPSVYLEFKD